MPKPSRGRGLMALMAEGEAVSKTLPEEVRAELHRMSKAATELLFKHIDYDEARKLMRHSWPSRYFRHLHQIARNAKL